MGKILPTSQILAFECLDFKSGCNSTIQDTICIIKFQFPNETAKYSEIYKLLKTTGGYIM